MKLKGQNQFDEMKGRAAAAAASAASAATTAAAVAAAVHMKSIFVHRWCKIKHGQDSKCRLCRFIERHNDTLLFVAKPVHTIKDSTRQFFQVFDTVLGGRLIRGCKLTSTAVHPDHWPHRNSSPRRC